MADWRHDPATEAQSAKLRELNVHAPASLTKGEASDLISAHMEPDDEEMEILSYFKVRGRQKMSQLEARQTIAGLLSDPERAARWQQHKAAIADTPDDPLADLIDGVGALIQDDAADYGCRRPSKALLKKTFRAMMTDGLSAEQIDEMADDPQTILTKAAEIDPSIVKDRTALADTPSTSRTDTRGAGRPSRTWLIIGVILLTLIILAFVI